MTNLEEAILNLKNGGVVIFPTDTVYGIGAKYDNKDAVNRLYGIKKTPKTQPLPILITDISQIEKEAVITPTARKLMNKYWPGALTIVLKSKLSNKKIGFRMPNQELVRNLIRGVGTPIVGTSANFHGKKTANSFAELDPLLIDLVDYVLIGECALKRESTVVDLSTRPPTILRNGAISLQEFI